MSKNFAGFNPDGLERAAVAVRELSSSEHANQVLQLQQTEQIAKAEEMKALQKQREINKIKVDHEERRKTLDKNLEINKESARYKDKLDRRKMEDQIKMQEEMQDRMRKKNEEQLIKDEEIKRKTLEHQLKIEEKKMMIQGKVDAENYRKNHDLHKQELIMREEQRRETLKQLFLLNISKFSSGFEYLMNNKQFVYNFFFYTAAVSSAFYLSRSSILLGMKFLESRFNKPSLIRETSRLTYKQFYKVPFKVLSGLGNQNSAKQQEKIFENIILSPSLKENLSVISYSLLNMRKHNAPLRNVMFYGPPGTGKTLFAKNLAYQSGLDYAIMTGADVAPLGAQSVHELHKVFDWANTNSRGMLLFIDEADAFFRKRDTDLISENLRNAINAFLYRTGTPSKKFMIVLATNQPEQMDKALQDRIDQILFFDKPGESERTDLLFMYFSKYCDPHYRLKDQLYNIWQRPGVLFTKQKVIRLDSDISGDYIASLSQKLEGFSAREIEKFVVSCHDKAFSMEDPLLTQELVNKALDQSLDQHKQREQWVQNNIIINKKAGEKNE